MIERLNYCTHAIEDLSDFQSHLDLPQTKLVMSFLVEQLNKSVKFILPDCGVYFDRNGLNQTAIDMLKLPFPVVAAEYTVKHPVIESPADEASSKRISLAIDVEKCPEIHKIFKLYSDKTILIWPIFYMDYIGKWIAHHCGINITKNQILEQAKALPTDEELEIMKTFHAKVDDVVLDYGLLPLGELHAKMKLEIPNPAEFRIRNFRDICDELFAMVQLCMVLNCQNIETLTIPAPAKLNQKRALKKKLPLYEYKVLQVNTNKNNLRHNQQNTGKNSPRLHIRRGHPRRLFNENHEIKKIIWVESCIVGNKDKGIIDKDYKV